MSRKHSNNISTTTTAAISAGDTNIPLSTTAGFPTINPGDIVTMTLTDLAQVEIVYITALGGSVVSVARGQEGTTPIAWPAGTLADIRLTAATIDDKLSRVDDVADQATMEAASSNTTYASPGNMIHHPGVAKAWVTFSAAGGVVSILSSYGIASVVRNSIGNYTITLSTPMSNTNYTVVGMGTHPPGGDKPGATVYSEGAVVTTNSFTIETARGGGDLRDMVRVSILVFGDQ